MREINFNVGGDPKADVPVVVTDNPPGGQEFTGRFEPGRWIVAFPLVHEIDGAATVWYQNRTKSFRVILPPLESFQAEAGEPPQLPPEYGGDADRVALHYAWVIARQGIVTFSGRSWQDTGGPYYPLGDTLLYALGHWHRGGALRDLVKENAQFVKSYDHDYVRWLGQVNWAEDIDPQWPNYQQEAAELIDWLYDECGLRSKITVTGGGLDVRQTANKLLAVLGGRQHKIQLIEAVNEQNASASDALAIVSLLKMFGVPIAVGRGNQLSANIKAEGDAARATVDCQHTERGKGTSAEPGGADSRQVRQCWDFKDYARPAEDGEGPGPTSSVATLDDPFRLAFRRTCNIVCGAGAGALHTGSGVFGKNYDSAYGHRYARLRDQPNADRIMRGVRNADGRLPRGIENWSKFNGGYGGPLIVSASFSKVNKIYGCRALPRFCEVVIGCDGPIELTAERACDIEVSNAETNEILFDGHLAQGQIQIVSGLWGYLLVGEVR